MRVVELRNTQVDDCIRSFFFFFFFFFFGFVFGFKVIIN
jgi:hypothetical protein